MKNENKNTMAADPGKLDKENKRKLAEMAAELQDINEQIKAATKTAEEEEIKMAAAAEAGQIDEYRKAREKHDAATNEAVILSRYKNNIADKYKDDEEKTKDVISAIDLYCGNEAEKALKKMSKAAREMFDIAAKLDNDISFAKNSLKEYALNFGNQNANDQITSVAADCHKISNWGYDVIAKYNELYAKGSGEVLIIDNMPGVINKFMLPENMRFIKAD